MKKCEEWGRVKSRDFLLKYNVCPPRLMNRSALDESPKPTKMVELSLDEILYGIFPLEEHYENL